ncbi:hypothetical protein GGG16DRAFT_106668 [Schizophyllum commune]
MCALRALPPIFRLFAGWVLVADHRGLIRKYATPFWKLGRRVGTAFDRSRSIKVLFLHAHHQLTPNTFIAPRAYPAITPVFVDVDYGLPLAIAHAAPRSTPAPRCVPAPQPSKAVRYGLPRRLEMPAALNFNTSCCAHTMLLDVLAAVATAVNVAQATSGALALSLHPHHIDAWTILKRGWRDRDGGAHGVQPTALHVPGINRTSRHVVGVLGERSELTWARHLLTAMLRTGVYARANDIPTPLFVSGESSKRRKDGEAADLSHALACQGQRCPSFCSPSSWKASSQARDKCRLSIGRVVIKLEPPQDEGARPFRGIVLKFLQLAPGRFGARFDLREASIWVLGASSNPLLIAQCDRRGHLSPKVMRRTSHLERVRAFPALIRTDLLFALDSGLCVVLASLPDYPANRCSALARYTSFSSVRRFRFRVLLVDTMSGKTSTRRSTGGDDLQALGNFVCS